MIIEIDMTEKEFQDLMTIWLMRQHNRTKVEIIREIYVGCSIADIVIFSPYYPGTIIVYELKMFNDKDKQRLDFQLSQYSKVADVIYVAYFGKPPDKLPENVNPVVCNIRDGKFNVKYLKEQYIENPKENINYYNREVCIKKMIGIWRSKADYAEKCFIHSQNKRKKLRQ